MRIKIENRTHWATRDLRRFVVRACNERLTDEYRARHSTLTVRFWHRTRRGYYSRKQVSDHCSGRAYIHGNWMHISLPMESVDRIDLAHVLAHELGHCLGMSHRDMSGGALWYRIGNWRDIYAWANELPLTRQKERAKPTRDQKRDAQLVRLQTRLRAWESKQRRAANAIKKLQRLIKRQVNAQQLANILAKET